VDVNVVDAPERLVALPVSNGLAWLAATQQLHGDARKRSPCFISDAPFDVSASSALREGRNTLDQQPQRDRVHQLHTVIVQ